MIDLHCHVLPGLDDGPPTVDDAIALAREAREDGITTIAATPHVDTSFPENDSARIEAAVADLQPRLDAAAVDLRIVTGAEVSSIRAIDLDDDELAALRLGGGPWLLLECPLAALLTPAFMGIARALARREHRLLLAHPERSPLFLRSPALLDELVAEGMLAQVTAGSLTGRYGRPARELGLRLVESGSAHVLASDGHGPHRPARIAGELAEVGLDPALAEWMARDVPAALLAGEEPPPRPAVGARSRRGRLARLLDR